MTDLNGTTSSNERRKTVLLVGASRGLGHAIAVEFIEKGWRVVGTVREASGTELHALAAAYPGQVQLELLDIIEPEQISALRQRLAPVALDILFVNAGTANRDHAATIGETSTEEFMRVLRVNALGVMRAIEALHDLVVSDGLIGAMSSGQGSIANNTGGGSDVYRASKAALNQLMRSFAARHADDPRAMVLMAPGWIRTDLGGPNAPYSIAETVPVLVETLLSQRGAGLRFIDRRGDVAPW